MNRIVNWFNRQLSNPQVVFLTLAIVGLLLVISYAGNTLAPVIAAVVIAYLLEGLINRMTRLKIPRFLSLWLVFSGFMVFLVSITLGLLPVLYKQLTEVVQQNPQYADSGSGGPDGLARTLPGPDFDSAGQ